MPNEKQLTNEHSLAIIHQMIGQAKSNISDNGVGWLLWGVMICGAAMSTYIFIDTGASNTFLGWNIFGILAILMLAYDVFKPKKKQVKNYVDDVLHMVNIGFIVCLFIIIVSINIAVTPNAGFGYFLMIFAFLMLIKGGVIKSRSLIVGAVVNWIGSVAMFINKDFKYDMLIMTAAVLVGYIIPGIILWRGYRKNKAPEKINTL